MDPSIEAQMLNLLTDISTELKTLHSTLKNASRDTNANIDEVVNRLGDVRSILDR
jgi:hypothetical protein